MIKIRKINYFQYEDTIENIQRICLEGDEPRVFQEADYWIMGFAGNIPACFAVVSQVSEDTWYLSRAGVLPEYRGQGLQLKMIRARVNAVLKVNPNARIITDTAAWNIYSSNNLIKAGFRTFWPKEPWGLPEGIYWEYHKN